MSSRPDTTRSARGVWITAYSASSALGQNVSDLRAGLVEGRSGLIQNPDLPPGFEPLPFAACLGVVPGPLSAPPPLPPLVDTRQLRMAWTALSPIVKQVTEAIAHFGPDRVG